jgi:hypothetical protein
MQFVEQLSVALFSYEWQDTNQWHTPVFLQKEQKMLCLWKTLLAHVFLKERDIEHYSLALPWHSALVVVLDGQWYYMDPTYSDRLHLVSGLWLQKISWMRKLWLNQYFIKDPVTYNPDMWLFAEMLINQWFYVEETKDFDLALLYYYMAILANPDNPYPYFNAVSLQEQYRLQSPVFWFSSKEMYHMYESKKKFIWKKK